MDVLIWIVCGLLVGMVAGRVIGTNRQQPWRMDLSVGVAGAVLTGLLITPVLGRPSSNNGHFGLGAAVVAVVGAALALIVVNVIRNRR